MRFDKYAWRVRLLNFDSAHPYNKEIFTEIALKRLRPLLPRLIELQLNHPLAAHVVSLFGHSTVQRLRLGEKLVNALRSANFGEDAAVALAYIPVTMPNLRSFKIGTNHDVTFMEEHVAAALRDINSLEEVVIPPCLLTGHVVTSLASLPRLRTLKTTWLGRLGYRPTLAPLPRGSYLPSLEILYLSYRAAVAWLSRSQFPSGLSELKIHAAPVEGRIAEEEYRTIAKQIASQCQQLVVISLAFTFCLSFKTIEPILSLVTLESLKLRYLYDFGLEQQHLTTICRSLPILRVLMISIILEPPKAILDLSILSDISPITPRLTTLQFPFTILSDGSLSDVVRFPKLSILDFAGAAIKPGANVANFLSRVLPERCAIHHDPGDSSWDTVKELRSMFAEVRQEERRTVVASIKSTGRLPDGTSLSDCMSNSSN